MGGRPEKEYTASSSAKLSATLERAGKYFEAEEVPASEPFRSPPAKDQQLDFFVPPLHDIPVKDGIGIMDVAVFRLSKKQPRKGELIRYELSDAVIEVSSGGHGMATIYDYDIVLMVISQLAHAVKQYRRGTGEKPGRQYHIHSSDIFKFCRLSDGGKQYEILDGALKRLQGTFITITSENEKKSTRRTGYFPLLGGAKVISRTDTGRIGRLEITIPDWIYEAVEKHDDPEVLTVNPDYFLLNKGIARFIYRLARKAAGQNDATYTFKSIHMRSGTTREFRKFSHELRQLIKADSLPDYHLAEKKGKNGPMLVIRNRRSLMASSSVAASTTIN